MESPPIEPSEASQEHREFVEGAGDVFRAASKQHLREGRAIIISREGKLIRVEPDGSEMEIGSTHPYVRVKQRTFRLS